MSKKILIICPFPEGVAAGQRLKYEQYLDDWRLNGFSITMSSFMDMKMWGCVYTKGNYLAKIIGTLRGYLRRLRDIFIFHRYDLVYVFMWVTPLGPPIFERIARLRCKTLIYDIEDNIIIKKSINVNPLVSIIKGTSKAKYLIKNADHVITSSPFLNDYCMTINLKQSCTYISSSINTDVFLPANTYCNDKVITIGWTGTFSSREYLDLLSNVFIKLNDICKFKLRVIGNFEYQLPGINLEVIQWTKINEVADLQGIDIGVYPLVVDEWVLGKSGLKAIQYMAFGLPVVATNYGTAPLFISNMKNGLLVNDEEEWLNALVTLINNPTLRRNLGESARKTVLENFSNNVIKEKYLSVLNKELKN